MTRSMMQQAQGLALFRARFQAGHDHDSKITAEARADYLAAALEVAQLKAAATHRRRQIQRRAGPTATCAALNLIESDLKLLCDHLIERANAPLAGIRILRFARRKPAAGVHVASLASLRMMINGVKIALAAGVVATAAVALPAAAGTTCDTVPDTINCTANLAPATTVVGLSKIILLDRGYNGDNGGLFVNATSGSPGPTAPDLSVTFNGAINSDAASAIRVIGRGGNGGSGGSGYAGATSGNGATGGNGSNILLTNHGGLITTGSNAEGIFAASIGGNGGGGGDNAVSIGHDGGGGGLAGKSGYIILNNTGGITTYGLTNSAGIVAQSRGGLGGSGGSTSWTADSNGGSGGTGANANLVSISNTGNVETWGTFSSAIIAQSIGGFGGDAGGTSFGIATYGGDGVTAGDGGQAYVANYNSLTTHRDESFGILVQSIGGGGGQGGSSSGLSAVGGNGGSGGSSKSASIDNYGSILTQGNNASAIKVQSIGGGGGDGGDSIGIATIGGQGGSGGNGNTVSVRNSGALTTTGNDSSGIYAQSIGGGGGSGGSAVSSSLWVGFAVGGSGAPGGDGKNVYINDTTTADSDDTFISTTGDRSFGIFAQSIGGGGGSGGYAVSTAVGESIAASVAIGGGGGKGGNSGAVNVKYKGQVTTEGDGAAAIMAQSIGGGGGNGGFAVSVAGSAGLALAAAVGGKGETGGNSDQASLTSWTAVATQGDNAHGLVSQSIGGGGGNGGFSIAGGVSLGSAASLTLGGGGGGGGNSAHAELFSYGTIVRTHGDLSDALLVQSIGGGGGSGGGALSASAALGVSIAAAAGGAGAKGGNAGTVDVTNNSYLLTEGNSSNGLVVQSIGGGGGSGGFSGSLAAGLAAGLSVSLGSGGGKGGDAEAVHATNTGTVQTYGKLSSALVVESIGGGGGNGGIAVALAGGGLFSGSMSLGGDGDSGGAGKSVTLTNSGLLTTGGERSYGIYAESLGGGGGNGGLSLSGAATFEGPAMAVALGGKGAAGQDADTVTVTNTGDIYTAGAASTALFAQSLGGGGGNGGITGSLGLSLDGGGAAVSLGRSGGKGGEAKKVFVDTTGHVVTYGDTAEGILAQSVGGGGGNGGGAFSASAGTIFAGSLALGGNGAKGGSGGDVELHSHSAVDTSGDFAHAVHAQSVGGGGGTGGFAIAGAFTSSGASVALGGGGIGATGGNGAFVQLYQTGDITTGGFGAYGIFAQSVGGGGGTGGFAATLSATLGDVAPSLALGGNGGTGGKAGIVWMDQVGSITTTGDQANAIVAQSVGGGGGTGGFALSGSISSEASVAVALGGKGGKGGGADFVRATSTGDLTTTGANAYGLFAQSVGGGGGNGGFAGALAGSSGAGAISVTLGGDSGDGGEGGTVDATTHGTITTGGEGSHAVFVQSVGGGGGNGGAAVSFTGTAGNSQQVSLAMGGNSGKGGKGGDVTLHTYGFVGTLGSDADGILAQSLGGGGGTGGLAFSGALSADKSREASVSLGGKGGHGETGGIVLVTNAADVETHGARSTGIFVQSLGGGGGAGGATGALSLAGSNSIAASLTIGGDGGQGAAGGRVEVTNDGTVWTTGEAASALIAQSIGGGGGHGGMAGIDPAQFSDYLAGLSASQTFGSKSMAMAFSFGGKGGAGDNGGDVKVTNNGTLRTDGDGSAVLFAQSVGGGGGDGGVAGAFAGAVGASKNGSLAVAFGGDGGEAGNGQHVEVINNGLIQSTGAISAGIYAQSVGGGGGSGGNAKGTAEAASTQKSKDDASLEALSISVGGKGGAAGDGGQVDVTNTGQIVTTNGLSHGVFAQSVGGGGGDGGSIATNYTEALTLANSLYHAQNGGKSTSVTIAIGGKGGASGDGGIVNVANSGGIHTEGLIANGVFAQSVGGGGGNGGAGTPGQVSIGGAGNGGGNGGVVTVTNTGVIETTGGLSRGIFAQSIGGGGGNGGNTQDQDDPYDSATVLNVMNYIITGVQDFTDLITSMKRPEFGIEIGGQGGVAGDGGEVHVTNNGTIHTTGVLAHGIFAQSVGGGGGTGGEGTIGKLGQIAFSGTGGGGGDGKAVTVTNTGTIVTEGFGAYGIFAQSVGGGGGVAGDISLGISELANVPGVGDYRQYGGLGINPLSGDGGNGGDVTVINTGDIYVNQAGGIGIFAQSIGGGGGLYGSGLGLGFAGALGGDGDSGVVTITQNGNVYASGINAIGAFLQSDTAHERKDITATFNGSVTGGSYFGSGVLVDGGKDNVINLNGWVSAASNLALRSTVGNDTFNSAAGILGNVELGSGSNTLNNLASSAIISADHLDLGGALSGVLNNAGALAPGDIGVSQTTAINGSFVQSASGKLFTDISLDSASSLSTASPMRAPSGAQHATGVVPGQADRLNVTGSAAIGGQVVVTMADITLVRPGTHSVTLVQADDGVSLDDVQLVIPPSGVARFQLEKIGSNRLDFVYSVDFADLGSDDTPNRVSFGDYINRVQLAGSSTDMGPVITSLFAQPDSSHVAQAYDSMGPETYASALYGQAMSAAHFADGLLSCDRFYSPEGKCVWGRVEGNRFDVSNSPQSLGYKQDGTRLQTGVEGKIAENLRAGFAIGSESVKATTANLTYAKGQRVQMGLVVKTKFQAVDVALSWTKGHTWLETSRAVPLMQQVASGRQDINYDMTAIRFGRIYQGKTAYLRPTLDVTDTEIRTSAMTETGAGALNLHVDASRNSILRLNPAIEAGMTYDAGQAWIKPYIRLGVSNVVAGFRPAIDAQLAGAPSGVDGFTVTAPLDKATTTVQAGMWIDGKAMNGLKTRISYSQSQGRTANDSSLSFKMTKAF